ncbi:MAG: D-alanine--D-alanine ligase, partial [Microgenomates group bacterium]
VRNLDKSKYDILPVVISRTGKKWQLVSPSRLLALPDPLNLKGTTKEFISSGRKEIQSIRQLPGKINVVFIAMHGPYSEDGTIQGMLELAGISYTGPGVLASALGMDKTMFRKVMQNEKIPVPRFVALKKRDSPSKIYRELDKPPFFVKPNAQGSSVGASIVRYRKDLPKALEKAFKYGETALVEEYIKGTEVACGVLGNEKPIALPLAEIVPLKGEFFNYDSKYLESGAEEIVPARISVKLTKRVQQMAIDVYKAIGCKGFSRVDFILKNGRRPIVLEINTIPGLTPMSLLPKAAKAAGISYSQLLDKIIKYAIK